MTPEERELRRALEARSGEARARVSGEIVVGAG